MSYRLFTIGCWAFGASTVYSWRLCIATKGATDVLMSTQYPISCDTAGKGCNGNQMSNAWKFFITYGEVAETAYPFVSQTGTCKATTAKKYYPVSYQQLGSVQAMQEEIYLNGPIQVGYYVRARKKTDCCRCTMISSHIEAVCTNTLLEQWLEVIRMFRC